MKLTQMTWFSEKEEEEIEKQDRYLKELRPFRVRMSLLRKGDAGQHTPEEASGVEKQDK